MANSITTEVVVIGGGITATAIAHALAKRGLRSLLLLEQRTTTAGVTGGSFGIVRTYHADRVMVTLARRSLRIYENFEEEVGHTAEFKHTGMLVLVPGAQQEAFERQIAVAQHLGSGVRLLATGGAALEIEPRLQLAGVAAAAYEREAGYGNPVQAAAAFVLKARDLGTKVREGIRILRVDTVGKPGNRSITGLLTDGGYVNTRCVVNAGGTWANEINEKVGVRLPVKPFRYLGVMLRPPPIFGSTVPPIVLDLAHQTVLRPSGPGQILMGPLAAAAEDIMLAAHTEPSTEQGDAQEYQRLLRRRFPELGTARVSGVWATAHDVSEDWHPIIGPVSGLGGYFCAVGMGGHAFCLAPAVGELVAHMITAARADSTVGLALPLPPPSIPIDPSRHAYAFRPDRFTDPHPPPSSSAHATGATDG